MNGFALQNKHLKVTFKSTRPHKNYHHGRERGKRGRGRGRRGRNRGRGRDGGDHSFSPPYAARAGASSQVQIARTTDGAPAIKSAAKGGNKATSESSQEVPESTGSGAETSPATVPEVNSDATKTDEKPTLEGKETINRSDLSVTKLPLKSTPHPSGVSSGKEEERERLS